MKYSYLDISKSIDHSLLQPNLSNTDIKFGCEIAIKYNVKSVMVRPCDVTFAKNIVSGSDVIVASTVGFPHGVNLEKTKVFEANNAIYNGAEEVDMVINISYIKSKMFKQAENDIKSIVDVANGKIVKVILENSYLTDEEKIIACKISENAGASFVKTSSGYAPTGATIEDVILMKNSVSSNVGVKAAGGIRTLDSMINFLDAGATRFGATATKTILDEYLDRF